MKRAKKAAAAKKMREHRDYKHLRELFDVVGSIRALEVTHGNANGWHPHLQVGHRTPMGSGQ